MVKLKMLGAMAVALLTFGAVGAPAGAAPPNSGREAVFNSPEDPTAIVDHLEELIRGSVEGSTIRIAEYRLRDEQITDALADVAKNGGVHVQVLVDGGSADDPNYLALKKALADTGDDESWVKDCGSGGCNGSNAMHNKFFLFSGTGDKHELVATGSANLSHDSLGGTGGWNSLFVDYVQGSQLFKRYLGYFSDLAQVADGGKPDANYYDTNPPATYGDIKSYFYPRTDGTGRDPVYNTLKSVDCDAQKTSIRIGMWSISRTGVAQKLHDLAKNPRCSVDIVANRISPKQCKILTAPTAGGEGRVTIRTFDRSVAEKSGIHEKNMMIAGHYVHDDTTAVFTGSHNYNYLSRRSNDENALRIQNDARIYEAYVKNFTAVQAAADVEIKSNADCPKIAPPTTEQND